MNKQVDANTDHEYMPRSHSLSDIANAALALTKRRMRASANVSALDIALLLGSASIALYVDHLRGAASDKVADTVGLLKGAEYNGTR